MRGYRVPSAATVAVLVNLPSDEGEVVVSPPTAETQQPAAMSLCSGDPQEEVVAEYLEGVHRVQHPTPLVWAPGEVDAYGLHDGDFKSPAFGESP
ncbi:hypothetical protein CYMTET_23352 [Cymbomonas tetramitiformis]|uniref:Uncharacterized protein n=1 Tax=Cymbomonas tetramitiformis TaxID=36881 RepID=A0AAE0L113_9CHLO|nr:hypothetical protein CYMTET_23352 [Cymbomonas tetramitiformis]